MQHDAIYYEHRGVRYLTLMCRIAAGCMSSEAARAVIADHKRGNRSAAARRDVGESPPREIGVLTRAQRQARRRRATNNSEAALVALPAACWPWPLLATWAPGALYWATALLLCCVVPGAIRQGLQRPVRRVRAQAARRRGWLTGHARRR